MWQASVAGAGAREARARAATRWLRRRGVWLGRWLLESGTLRDGAAGGCGSVGLAGWLLVSTGLAKDTLSSGAAGLAVVGAVGLAEVGLLIGGGDGSRLMRTWRWRWQVGSKAEIPSGWWKLRCGGHRSLRYARCAAR